MFVILPLVILALFIAPSASAADWYVSKSGNNSSGISWQTAWNELSQINWSAVNPGDTVFLDGGSPSMTYTSTLALAKNGSSSSPIMIRVSSEPGRNGQVRIFGGRTLPLPECGQSSYNWQTSGVRQFGIDAGSAKWVTVDGGRWNGIFISGHNHSGINLNSGNDQIVLRNMEITDNGNVGGSPGNWYPDQQGIDWSGSNITLERLNIHDNGQDALQSGGGINQISGSGFTLRESWLYNKRPHSTLKGLDGNPRPFNECRHPDGLQVYDGGTISNFLIERSIIGPGFMQGVLLGGNVSSQNQYAVVNNVTIRDSLFIDASNDNIAASGGGSGSPSLNWTIDQVTSVRPIAPPGTPGTQGYPCTYGYDTWWNFHFHTASSGHTVKNSVIVGGCSVGTTGAVFSNNCQWGLNNSRDIRGAGGIQADPQFTDRITDLANNDFGDFHINNNSCRTGTIPRGVQSFQSVSEFLTMVGSPSVPQSSPAPIPSTAPSGSLTFEAESGQISAPFTVSNGLVSQSVETTDPAQGGKALYSFMAPETGNYLISAVVSAPTTASNSFYVNIDDADDIPIEPAMVWDVPVASGLQSKTVSWRGTGTVDQPQSSPHLFYLTAGSHRLVIRGREANTGIDRFTISLSPLLPGDINRDSQTNIQDFVLLSLIFGSSDITGDLNRDGQVNIQDFIILSNHFGRTSSP